MPQAQCGWCLWPSWLWGSHLKVPEGHTLRQILSKTLANGTLLWHEPRGIQAQGMMGEVVIFEGVPCLAESNGWMTKSPMAG